MTHDEIAMIPNGKHTILRALYRDWVTDEEMSGKFYGQIFDNDSVAKTVTIKNAYMGDMTFDYDAVIEEVIHDGD